MKTPTMNRRSFTGILASAAAFLSARITALGSNKLAPPIKPCATAVHQPPEAYSALVPTYAGPNLYITEPPVYRFYGWADLQNTKTGLINDNTFWDPGWVRAADLLACTRTMMRKNALPITGTDRDQLVSIFKRFMPLCGHLNREYWPACAEPADGVSFIILGEGETFNSYFGTMDWTDVPTDLTALYVPRLFAMAVIGLTRDGIKEFSKKPCNISPGRYKESKQFMFAHPWDKSEPSTIVTCVITPAGGLDDWKLHPLHLCHLGDLEIKGAA